MEFIPFKKNMKGHCSFSQQRGFFRNEEARISQRLGVFAVRGNSASISQPISQLRKRCMTLRNGARVPKRGFVATKHPSKW